MDRWHLFPLRLQLDRLAMIRNTFFEEMRQRGIGCSVHWRPLALHARSASVRSGWARHLPCATSIFNREISLPLFPSMRTRRIVDAVAETVNVPILRP